MFSKSTQRRDIYAWSRVNVWIKWVINTIHDVFGINNSVLKNSAVSHGAVCFYDEYLRLTGHCYFEIYAHIINLLVTEVQYLFRITRKSWRNVSSVLRWQKCYQHIQIFTYWCVTRAMMNSTFCKRLNFFETESIKTMFRFGKSHWCVDQYIYHNVNSYSSVNKSQNDMEIRLRLKNTINSFQWLTHVLLSRLLSVKS